MPVCRREEARNTWEFGRVASTGCDRHGRHATHRSLSSKIFDRAETSPASFAVRVLHPGRLAGIQPYTGYTLLPKTSDRKTVTYDG